MNAMQRLNAEVDEIERQQLMIDSAIRAGLPHVIFRPRLFLDGNKWCALHGEDLQSGLAGFGDTPALACADFDRNFYI